jgi:lipoyl(octanoyl) transferase
LSESDEADLSLRFWFPLSSSSLTVEGSLEVHLLGLVDFDSVLALQERLVYEISGSQDQTGALLICEHPPLVTLGADATAADVLADAASLRRSGIDVRWLGRGGGAVCHAPGQLAVYAVLPLERMGLDVAQYRDRMEAACVSACQEVHVPARQRGQATGVWGRAGQLAMIGAAVKNGVVYHGMFVNVSPDPSFLALARSNPEGEPPTSLQAQLLRRVPMGRVREALARMIQSQFGYTASHHYTGHPLLRRTIRKVATHA